MNGWFFINHIRESCSIQCVLAMGIIPQLQCRKCQFMYHQECIGKDGSRRSGSFVCEVYQIFLLKSYLSKDTNKYLN